MRGAIAALLLALETLISVPVFVATWLVCAAWFAVVAGWKFAQVSEGADKRALLVKALGEKGEA